MQQEGEDAVRSYLLTSKLYHSSAVITWHAPDTLTISSLPRVTPHTPLPAPEHRTEDCINQTLIKSLKQTLRDYFHPADDELAVVGISVNC